MDAVPFHIGITTENLTASMRELSDALGVSWTEPSGGDKLFHSVDGTPQPRPISCISRQGPIHFDLIEGKPNTIWATTGPRLHHFAYWTDDLRGDIKKMAEEGWELELTNPDENGEPNQFAYLVRADGLRLELIDDAGRDDYTSRLD